MTEELISRCVFPEGKLKAFTQSYDDGVCHDRRLAGLMRQYGIKGTFNINSGKLGRSVIYPIGGREVDFSTVSAEELEEVYRDMEIATHGRSHCSMTHLGGLAVTEIHEDRLALESLLHSLVCGHAYPYGSYDEQVKTVLRAAGIRYARTTVSTHSFELPRDFLEWHPTCHHSDPELMPLLRRFAEGDTGTGEPWLFYLWGHSFEFAVDGNWPVIEEALAYISGFRDQVWFATNGEIADYLEAAGRLVFSADGQQIFNPSVIPVWFERTPYMYPRHIVKIGPGELVSL